MVRDLANLPSNILWFKIYKNNNFATDEAKLRSLQIRLNLKSIVTNVQLYGLEIVDSNYCVFCLEEPETIMNLFCNCKFVDMCWCDVSDRLSVKFFYDLIWIISINYLDFKKTTVSLRLLLYTRFLIYRCKFSKCKPNMAQYFNLVNSIRKSEHFIAKTNMT